MDKIVSKLEAVLNQKPHNTTQHTQYLTLKVRTLTFLAHTTQDDRGVHGAVTMQSVISYSGQVLSLHLLLQVSGPLAIYYYIYQRSRDDV